MTDLTSDIAIRLAAGWRELLADDVLARVVGIDYDVLRQWLVENKTVQIVRTFKRIAADGSQTTTHETQTVGIADLRQKEMNRMEYELLQQYSQLIKDAQSDGEIKAAMRGIEWRLAKAMPNKYGRDVHPVNVNILDLPVID